METDILLDTILKQFNWSSLDLTLFDFFIKNLFAIVSSTIIFFTYRAVYTSDNYKAKLNIFLVMIVFITIMVISIIKSSFISSIGLIGIISLVRFRVKLKDFRDICFILWAVTVGVAIGVGYYGLGVLYSLFLSLVLICLNMPLRIKARETLLIIRGKELNQKNIEKLLKAERISYILSGVKEYDDYTEYIYHFQNEISEKMKEKIVNELELDFIKFI